MISCVMQPAARGGSTRPAPPRARAAAGSGRSAGPVPVTPPRRRREITVISDAASEVKAAEGDTARREATLVSAAAAASVRQPAPPAKANKNSNDGGDSAVANCEISEPSEQVHNANAKALEAAARTAADAVREKELIQVELDKMKARLKAVEQGSGGRRPQNRQSLSDGE
jgi:hypothetical protein